MTPDQLAAAKKMWLDIGPPYNADLVSDLQVRALHLIYEIERLRSDEYEHIGWGLRANPDAPCEWYLTPRVDTTKPGNTGSNKPSQPPWEPVFRKVVRDENEKPQ